MANIVTSDDTWVYFFKSHRKAANKIWALNHLKRPCIARRVQSAKKVLYLIFFDIEGHVPNCYSKGTRNHWQVLQKLCSKKLKSYNIGGIPRNACGASGDISIWYLMCMIAK